MNTKAISESLKYDVLAQKEKGNLIINNIVELKKQVQYLTESFNAIKFKIHDDDMEEVLNNEQYFILKYFNFADKEQTIYLKYKIHKYHDYIFDILKRPDGKLNIYNFAENDVTFAIPDEKLYEVFTGFCTDCYQSRFKFNIMTDKQRTEFLNK